MTPLKHTESEKDDFLEQIIDLSLAGKDASKKLSALDRLHRNKVRHQDIEDMTPKNSSKKEPQKRQSEFTLSINPVTLF